MFKFLSLGLLFLVVSSCSVSKESFLVGTYTDSAEQGFHCITFNENSNEITKNVTISGAENPSFIVSNKAKNRIYLVEETASSLGGKITSFSYNAKLRTFQKINSQATLGDHPCSLALSPNEKFVVVTNYSGGNITVFPLDKDGKLGQSIQEKTYFNKGPNPNRQEKSHLHEVVFHPTEKILFVTDLGGDIIQKIPFDEDSLTPLQLDNSSEIKLTSGVGPRHLLFTKNGKMAYATFELTNQLGIFSFENKQLKFIKAIPLTDEDSTENGSAAELRLSNDDKFLYVSLRGDFNVLVGLDVSDATNPKEIQRINTQIKPRNFIITSSENYILVGNEISNSIISFKRNKKTGLLQQTKLVYPMHKPTYFFNF